jgi:hypothetical protein
VSVRIPPKFTVHYPKETRMKTRTPISSLHGTASLKGIMVSEIISRPKSQRSRFRRSRANHLADLLITARLVVRDHGD